MATRQDRVELKGSARAAFPSGQDVGPADPNQQIEVSVLLRRGSKPGDFPSVDQMGSRLPRDRKYLTREEFAKQYGASPADLEKVRAFATQYNLKVASEDRASRTIKLAGTVQAFNDAFGANLRRYEHASGSSLPHRRTHDSRRPRRHHRRRSRPRQSPTSQTAFPSTQEKPQRATERHRRLLLATASRQSIRFPVGRDWLRPMHCPDRTRRRIQRLRSHPVFQ